MRNVMHRCGQNLYFFHCEISVLNGNRFLVQKTGFCPTEQCSGSKAEDRGSIGRKRISEGIRLVVTFALYRAEALCRVLLSI